MKKMKTIKRCLVLFSVILLAFSLSSCFGIEQERAGIYLNINAEKIQSIEIDFWCGDKLRSTTGCSNADGTEMEIGQAFGFDKPLTGDEAFTCDITFVTTEGNEINGEKTKVSLPGGQTVYELEVFTDSEGEYSVRILSVKKEY